jgi:hypothetical protein
MLTMSAVLTEPSAGPAVTPEQVRRAPKVLLHDHLDGGLRPATIVELAAEVGHPLPAPDAESLGRWFTTMADSGSLVKYLETFDHTVAVMQTASSLTRVARECVEDLAADGVVYAEVRYAPEQHVTGGLTLDEVVAAVQEGFDAGVRIGEMLEREMIGVRVSGDLRAAIVGSPEYFRTRSKPKHPRELQAHDCINYRRRKSGVVYKWEFTENGRDLAVAVRGRVLLDDGETMIGAALAGLGLAYVFESAVREELASKRLVRVLDAFSAPFPGLFLYYPSRAQLAPKLQALIDFLRVAPPKKR